MLLSGKRCPCKGCEKREIGCHASCADYIAFTEENKRIRTNYRREELYPAYKKRRITDYYSKGHQ